MKPQRPFCPERPRQASWLMIGTLILVFVGLMAIAYLCLLLLIKLRVIDQQLSLLIFVAAVPLAAYVALDFEAVELGDVTILGHDETPVIDIDRLWPRESDDVDIPGRRRPRRSTMQDRQATGEPPWWRVRPKGPENIL